MYGTAFEVSDDVMGKDFLVPIGKAKIQRPGKHVTICTFSKMVGFSLEAADILAKDGIDVEVRYKEITFDCNKYKNRKKKVIKYFKN